MSRLGGKKSKAVPFYLLRKTAQVDRTSAVIEPTLKTVARRINPNFANAMSRVLIKPSKTKIA
jgi:hypothetical protein